MTRSGYPVREAFPVPIGRLGKYIFFGGQKKIFFWTLLKNPLQRHFKNILNCYFEGCNQIGWLFGLQIYLGILCLECLHGFITMIVAYYCGVLFQKFILLAFSFHNLMYITTYLKFSFLMFAKIITKRFLWASITM